MALPSLSWLARVGESALKAIPFFGSGLGLIALVFDFGEKLLVGSINYVIDTINAMDTSMFSNAAFASVQGIAYANAVFPLSEFVTIWTAVFAAAAGIILIRWVKSFVPTVAN
jgi:hypothetical protein